MYLDPRDLVQRTILITGSWEEHQAAWLRGTLRPGNVYIDVGANVGYFALVASQRVGREGKVIAIEPGSHTADVLELNARRNSYPISLERCACVDRENQPPMMLFRPVDSGQASLAAGAAGSEKGESVPTKTLDQIVREHGLTRVDVIKIDVEGAEHLVIQGAVETLNRFHPQLMIEIEPENLKHFGRSREDIFRLLADNGYAVKDEMNGPDYIFGSAAVSSSSS